MHSGPASRGAALVLERLYRHLPAMERHLHIAERTGWPDEILTLSAGYPREVWDAHPHLRKPTRNWMAAHAGFRRLADVLRDDAEQFLDAKIAADFYGARLARLARMLTVNLHGHHTFEDRSFFPEINAVDPRFGSGLEVLEADHMELDQTLDRFERHARRSLQLAELDPGQLKDEVGALHKVTEGLQGFLARHLADEEDLIVPIILHHRMRG